MVCGCHRSGIVYLSEQCTVYPQLMPIQGDGHKSNTFSKIYSSEYNKNEDEHIIIKCHENIHAYSIKYCKEKSADLASVTWILIGCHRATRLCTVWVLFIFACYDAVHCMHITGFTCILNKLYVTCFTGSGIKDTAKELLLRNGIHNTAKVCRCQEGYKETTSPT